MPCCQPRVAITTMLRRSLRRLARHAEAGRASRRWGGVCDDRHFCYISGRALLSPSAAAQRERPRFFARPPRAFLDRGITAAEILLRARARFLIRSRHAARRVARRLMRDAAAGQSARHAKMPTMMQGARAPASSFLPRHTAERSAHQQRHAGRSPADAIYHAEKDALRSFEVDSARFEKSGRIDSLHDSIFSAMRPRGASIGLYTRTTWYFYFLEPARCTAIMYQH